MGQIDFILFLLMGYTIDTAVMDFHVSTVSNLCFYAMLFSFLLIHSPDAFLVSADDDFSFLLIGSY